MNRGNDMNRGFSHDKQKGNHKYPKENKPDSGKKVDVQDTNLKELINLKEKIISLQQIEDASEIEHILSLLKNYINDKRKVNSSFIRNLYNRIIAADTLIKLKLQIPMLLYYAARQQDNEKKKAGEIAGLFEQLITAARKEEHLKNVKYFAESFIAYHKYFEKR